MTSIEIIKHATDSMRFLRTCGSEAGPRQADAIQRLISRYTIYENKLISINAITLDLMGDVAPKPLRHLHGP